MGYQSLLQNTESYSLREALAPFRATFDSIYPNHREPVLDTSGQIEDLRSLTLLLLSSLQSHPTAGRPDPDSFHGTLRADILKVLAAVASGDYDLNRIRPLLWVVLSDDPRDSAIWDRLRHITRDFTSCATTTACSAQDSLQSLTSGSVDDTGCVHGDKVVKSELGPLLVELPRFREIYFSRVYGLELAANAVFLDCQRGSSPLFCHGWTEWPKDANPEGIFGWLTSVCQKLSQIAEQYQPTLRNRQRRPSIISDSLLGCSKDERKLQFGFVADEKAEQHLMPQLSELLFVGVLHFNPLADEASRAGLDLGRLAREVLAAQASRRFILGFTICGSIMRMWEFDRLGGVASPPFDLNKDALQFVSTVLGFLWICEAELGSNGAHPTASPSIRSTFLHARARISCLETMLEVNTIR